MTSTYCLPASSVPYAISIQPVSTFSSSADDEPEEDDTVSMLADNLATPSTADDAVGTTIPRTMIQAKRNDKTALKRLVVFLIGFTPLHYLHFNFAQICIKPRAKRNARAAQRRTRMQYITNIIALLFTNCNRFSKKYRRLSHFFAFFCDLRRYFSIFYQIIKYS